MPKSDMYVYEPIPKTLRQQAHNTILGIDAMA